MNVLWLLRRGNPSSAASLVPVVKHESTAKRSETANIRTRITGATSAEHAQIKIRFNTAHRWNVPEFTSCYVCSAYKSKSCLSMHTIWVKYILEPTPQTSSHLYTDVHACVHSSITTIIGRSVVRELLCKQLYKQSVSKLVHHIKAVLSASRFQHRALTDRNPLVTKLVCLLGCSPVQTVPELVAEMSTDLHVNLLDSDMTMLFHLKWNLGMHKQHAGLQFATTCIEKHSIQRLIHNLPILSASRFQHREVHGLTVLHSM